MLSQKHAGLDRPYKIFRLDPKVISACAFSPDRKQILLASFDSNPSGLWTYSEGKSLFSKEEWKQTRTFVGHTARVNALAFSMDGKNMLSASSDTTVRLWDNSNGKCMRVFEGHAHYVTACAFNSKKFILSASYDKTVRLWDCDSGASLKTFIGHHSAVLACIFSPADDSILSASSDNTLILWDLNGNHRHTFSGHTWAVRACAFSPNGQFIVSASQDKTLKLWNLQGQCLRTFEGHSDYVVACAFSPDGQRIVSASYDNTIKVWNLEGNCEQTFTGSNQPVIACTFNATGESIFSLSNNGAIEFWDVKKLSSQAAFAIPRPATPPLFFSIPAAPVYLSSASLSALWEHFSTTYPGNAIAQISALRQSLEQRAALETTKQLAQQSIFTKIKQESAIPLSAAVLQEGLPYIAQFENLQLCYYQMQRKLSAWFMACLSLYSSAHIGGTIIEAGRTLEHINILGTVIPLPDAPFIYKLVHLLAKKFSDEKSLSPSYDSSSIDIKAYISNIETITISVARRTVENYHAEILSLTDKGAAMLGEWCLKPVILCLLEIDFSSQDNTQDALIKMLCAAIQRANTQPLASSGFINNLLKTNIELPLQDGRKCTTQGFLNQDAQMMSPETVYQTRLRSRLPRTPGSTAMQTSPPSSARAKRRHQDDDA